MVAAAEPRIRAGLSFADYQAKDALNPSTLIHGLDGMDHLRAALDGELPDKDSDDLNFGRAYHCKLLEPPLFAGRYPIATPCCAILQSGARKGQPCGLASSVRSGGVWYCGKHGNGEADDVPEYVSPGEAAHIDAMVEKIKRHPVVALLRQHGWYEASIFSELEGFPVKGRVDRFIPKGKFPQTIIDVKKVRSGHANHDKFARAIMDFHYDFKAAMYVDMAQRETGHDTKFVWIVQEDQPPHSVYVKGATDREIACGRAQYASILQRHRLAIADNFWPGPSAYRSEDGVWREDIDWNQILPEWWIKRHAGDNA